MISAHYGGAAVAYREEFGDGSFPPPAWKNRL
jgi:hypothetical protein